jgi:hypothetical protein
VRKKVVSDSSSNSRAGTLLPLRTW